MRREWKPLIGAGILLMVLPLAMFWQVWWPEEGKRQVFTHGDFVEQQYPWRVFVADELQHGRLPLWDPYTFGGEPIMAAGQAAAYYPLALWQAVLPGRLPFWAVELEAILHLGLAGVFTALLVRRLTGRLDAGVISGVAFSLGGFLTSYPMLQTSILRATIWLPAGLWVLEIALSRRSLCGIGLAGAVLGMGLLAGHPQTYLYVSYTVFAYLLFRSRRLGVHWRFAVLAMLLLGGVTLGAGAAQWAPSLELANLSRASRLLGDEEVSHGFGTAELWGLVRSNPGQWSPLYAGAIPLVLALVALVLKRRDSQVWFWTSVCFISVLLSLGRNGFLYPVAQKLLPGFALFRHQERSALLVSLSLCVLAGYGYSVLAQKFRRREVMLVVTLLLVFIDLFHANNGVVLQEPLAGGYFASTAISECLQGLEGSDWRISSESQLPGRGNAGILFKVRDVTGDGPLYLSDYRRFLEVVPELRWFQMLNVQYIVTRRELDHGALKLILKEGDRHLYQVFVGGNPAWVTHEFELAPSSESATQRTSDWALDPMKRCVLEREPDPLPQPAIGQDVVDLLAFENQRIVIDVALNSPGVLVVAESFYPGWVVRVNGERARALRAFGLLRAVALPEGYSHVEWIYRPMTAYVGLAISMLTVLAVGIAAIRGWRQLRLGSNASAPTGMSGCVSTKR